MPSIANILYKLPGTGTFILFYGLMLLAPMGAFGNNPIPGCDPNKAQEYDVAPEILWLEKPVYPVKLRQTGNIGDVGLALTINADGTASHFEIRQSLHPSLETAVIDALMKASFKPALKNGKPITVAACQRVVFHLDTSFGSAGVNPYKLPEESSKDLPKELQYDQPPQPLIVTAPVYPFDLAKRDVEGSAKVSFLIGPDGNVVETHIIEASQPEFGLATAAMMDSWRFVPALKYGQKTYAFFVKEQKFNSQNRDSGFSETALEFLKTPEDENSKIYSLAELDKPPNLRYQVMPVFPPKPSQQQSGETITLEFFLDETGSVQWPHIVTANNMQLAWDAATALARWRFDPPLRAGKPVRARLQIPFDFGRP